MQAKQYTVCTYQKTKMFPLHPKMPETRLRIALMMQKTSPLPLGGTGEIWNRILKTEDEAVLHQDYLSFDAAV